MRMTSIKMKRLLEDKLKNSNYRTSYNRDNDQFRIEWRETKKGITVQLPQLIAKYNERGEEAVDAIVFDINEALKLMNEQHSLKGMEKNIYPVIRSTSFPKQSNGKNLIVKEHTAETAIFYALDLERSYRLIDENMLREANLTVEMLNEMAMFNLRSLTVDYKQDEVHNNIFYFVATQDGYDASRILNDTFLEEMVKKCEGQMAISVPHQDVLIISDIRNDSGFDILAQMTMRFFSEGRIPITSLSFMYEDKQLEPIFIMARTKPKDKK